MQQKTRMERLYRLLETVRMFKGSRGQPVRLDGHERAFNMWHWDCGTAACAAGAYKLTPYGQRNLRGLDPEELAEMHFGLSEEEGKWLFMPGTYFLPSQRPWANQEEPSIPPYQVERRILSIIRRYERGEGDMQRAT